MNEDAKQALFVKGTSTSQTVHQAMVDLLGLKKPDGTAFQKKNNIHPFEDPSSLEFFSEKNDTSLLVFGSHSKKRPHTLTFVRTFAYKILDMMELHIMNFKGIDEFPNQKSPIGLKPLLLFSGPLFDSHPSYQHIRSLLTDFYRGQELSSINIKTLQYIISISCAEANDVDSLPLVHFRVYLLRTKKSGQKAPRAELEEMGPSIDFRIGRIQSASESTMKEALKRPKELRPKQKKNVQTDMLGDKIGRIHVGKQDLGELQTRKMKGLKRKFVEGDIEQDIEENVESDLDDDLDE